MNEKNIIKNRSEILFLYDVENANPNGDPLDEDKPRIDDETDINYVTDVRLKRTVRDYLDQVGENIFIREEKREDGTQKTRSRRLAEFLAKNKDDFESWDMGLSEVKKLPDRNRNDVDLNDTLGDVSIPELRKALLETYIDLRLFGATIAVENSTVTEIGPVQFNFGKSLHQVSPNFVKGTTVMPSKEDVEQGTWTEMWVVPYSMIGFHGILNENAAQETGVKTQDLDLLLEGLWNGTKNLLTRSKKGHTPRLILNVEYNEDNFHIGELDKSLELTSNKEEKEIRQVKDYYLDVTKLFGDLEKYSSKINDIRYKLNPRLQLRHQGEDLSSEKFKEKLSAVGNVEELTF